MDQLSERELILLSGAAVAGFLFLMGTLWLTRRNRVQERLDELSLDSASSKTDSGTGGSKSTRGNSKNGKDDALNGDLIDRVMQAGLYRPQMIAIYQTVRFSLSLIPGVIVFIAFQSSMISLLWAVVVGVGACLFGFLAPSLWLDYKKAGRQTTLRRALPDALDVIIICVEAGLSVQAAMAKVSRELSSVHPLLAAEMAICQREMQLGASAGEALNRLAQRFDLAEMRSLASVVSQAERFGASIITALRVHAQTLREKRFQRAEELAQKAGVKLVFPTIVFIFPALFVVLAGPAVVRIFGMFDKMAP
ncbi:MAG: type II secretion system F family protein [Rubripirellula sp.]